jgi:hypothetical protein
LETEKWVRLKTEKTLLGFEVVMMEIVKLNGSKFWISEWWQLQQEANLGKQRIKKHIISL